MVRHTINGNVDGWSRGRRTHYAYVGSSGLTRLLGLQLSLPNDRGHLHLAVPRRIVGAFKAILCQVSSHLVLHESPRCRIIATVIHNRLLLPIRSCIAEALPQKNPESGSLRRNRRLPRSIWGFLSVLVPPSMPNKSKLHSSDESGPLHSSNSFGEKEKCAGTGVIPHGRLPGVLGHAGGNANLRVGPLLPRQTPDSFVSQSWSPRAQEHEITRQASTAPPSASE